MKGRRLLICSVVLNGFAFVAAHGQLVHFEPIPSTGQDASLVLPTTANPSIDGVQLATGDEVGVFSTEGLTVGAGSWTGENIVVTIWGDDSLTPEIDGVVPGDTLLIRVWDQSVDEELDDVIATYSQGDGLYTPDAILQLSSLDAQSDLPVELASFEAGVSGTDVRLDWATLSERGNAGFEIQLRTGESEFIRVGFVAGAGNSDKRLVYSYNVADLEVGEYAFRLKQVDYTNNHSYGRVVEVSVLGAAPELLGNFPNPFKDHTTITYSLPTRSDVSLRLFDVTGREVRVLARGSKSAGAHQVTVDATGMPAGVYFQRLQVGESVVTRRLHLVR